MDKYFLVWILTMVGFCIFIYFIFKFEKRNDIWSFIIPIGVSFIFFLVISPFAIAASREGYFGRELKNVTVGETFESAFKSFLALWGFILVPNLIKKGWDWIKEGWDWIKDR